MKFGKVLHIILAILIVIFMSGHFLLNNKKIQQKTAQYIVKIVKSSLNADVSAGRTQIVYPFGIAIDDLAVFDLEKDTLVKINSAVIRLKPLQLLKNKVSITSIRLQSPSVKLSRTDSVSEPNYAFLTNLSKGGEGASKSFRANLILIRNGSIRYDLKSAEQTDSIFNKNHIAISGLNANLSLKAMASDSLAFIVRKLAFAEQAGFKLSRTKGSVTVGKDFTHVSNLQFTTPGSEFNIAELYAQAGFVKRPEGIPSLDTHFNASVTGSDFKSFFPKLTCLEDPIDITLDCSGNGTTLSVSSLALSAGDIFDIKGRGTILTGQEKIFKGCRDLRLNGKFNDDLADWLGGQLCGFGITLPDQCHALGDGSFNLVCNSTNGDINSDIDLVCQAGTLHGSINSANGTHQASLQGKEIMLDALTGNSDFGKLDILADATITGSQKQYSGTFSSDITSLTYKNYDYRDIAVNGTIEPEKIVSDLVFSDRNGSLLLDASVGIGDNPSYDLRITADSLNLSAYNLTERDNLILSARFAADLDGKNIDEINGKLSLDSLSYSDSEGSWDLENLTANIGDVNESTKSISLFGDFINLSVVGDYSISALPYTLSRACGDVLPTIGKMVASNLGDNTSVRPNNFVINADIENTDMVKPLLHFPLDLKDPAKFRFSFNDSDSIYSGQVSVPSIEVAGENISQLQFVLNTDKGTCRSELSGKYGDKDKVDVRASILAFEDIIRGTYNWSNTQGDIRGSAKSLSQFFRYDPKNGLKSMILIDSTKVYVNNTEWKVSITDIRTDKGKITVNGLDISNIDQKLGIDGTVSADSSDILNVFLKNIDLDHTLSMMHANSIMLKGIASGNISIAGLTGRPVFYGSFNIDDFEFMDSYHGRLAADCHWDQINEKVVLNGEMTNPGIERTLLSGHYIPKTNDLDVIINARHTDLHFLNHWTSGVFKELSGRATGSLRLFGTLPDLDLEGESLVEEAEFVQESVNTSFFIKQDTLWFKPGQMRFTDVEFYDEYGHDGILSCILNHDHFSNWSVDMTADVADMLVYNQPRTEKSSFYATVYAEGSMRLLFDKRNGLGIQVDARTAPGTRLGLKPNAGSVADYNFITIVDRNTVEINDDAVSAILSDNKKKSSNFSLNLNIQCSEDAIIDLSVSSLSGFFRGNGDVYVNYTPKNGVFLNGIYNLSQGQCTFSVEDLIRKNFTLLDGSYVRFYGSPMDTELNLLTYHNVNSVSIYDLDPSASSSNNVRVRCLLGISGNVSEPKLTFDIDMPTGTSEEKETLASATATEEQRNIQFIYLLAIGRFYTFNVNPEMNAGLTPSAMESLVNSTVTGQVNNLLSQVLDNDKVSISSNLSASSYLNNDATNLNNKELEGILEAHLLNNRLLVNGSFGYRENTINNTSSFVGDLDAKYLLYETPRHDKKLSIRGYNKSNDKYFSKTTLTTQGVGLIFEMDF